jgi:hypothetical protein
MVEITERAAFVPFLEAFLGMIARNCRGMISLASEHAEEMGLKSLGVFETWAGPEKAPVLKFQMGKHLGIDWNKVCQDLLAIGKPTGLYAIPSAMLFGIRGEKGDITVRLADIQQRRLDGVLQCLKDNPD